MSLSANRHKPLLIALICPSYVNEIISALVEGLIQESESWHREFGQAVDFQIVDGGYLGPEGSVDHSANALYSLIHRGNYDGAIGFSGVLSHFSTVEYLSDFYNNIPVPLIEIGSKLPGFSSVIMDNSAGTYAMAKHLIELHGLNKLGFVRGPATHPEAIERLEGFIQAMRESDLAIRSEWVLDGDFTALSGERCGQEIQRLRENGHELPQAILCANDEMARGLMGYLHQVGLRIPLDIAVVGFDNRDFCLFQNPPLTSVNQPIGALVGEAFRQLIDSLNSRQDLAEKTFKLPTELIIRESCGCAAGSANANVEIPPIKAMDFTKSYLNLRDAKYAADRISVGLQDCQDNKSMGRLLNYSMDQFGMENWSLFLFDPSDPRQAISFASSAKDMHWAQIWNDRPKRGANGEVKLIRVIRPLIWDNQFQGAIVIDSHPDSILSVRDLTLVINNYLHNREAQRTLSIQNERLSSNLALLQATQQSLVEARKIASLGHLLAGFSHEINTPLGVAITVTSFLESQVQDLADKIANKDALAQPLESIHESTALINSNLLRIRELIRQLQILAQRNDDDIPVDFRLVETVDFAVLVKKNQLQGKGISVTVEGEAEVTINSLRNRLLVVINQLLDNAIAHAWPTGSAGSIRFTIRPETDFITIHYRDDGVGLTPAIFKHLFEPFVTTARINRHMGLGLHLIFLIVNHMLGGKIEIDDTAKSGFSLIINLPRVFAGMTLQV